jgi:hypothetical protein
VELEGAVQSANVKERKNSRQESTDQSGPAGIDISTALTAGQAYDSVVAAWRSGRLTDTQTKQAVELLKLRSGVVAAEQFHQRLAEAEAAHRANLAVQRQLAAPARRQVVEVGQSPASPIAEASTP